MLHLGVKSRGTLPSALPADKAWSWAFRRKSRVVTLSPAILSCPRLGESHFGERQQRTASGDVVLRRPRRAVEARQNAGKDAARRAPAVRPRAGRQGLRLTQHLPPSRHPFELWPIRWKRDRMLLSLLAFRAERRLHRNPIPRRGSAL